MAIGKLGHFTDASAGADSDIRAGCYPIAVCFSADRTSVHLTHPYIIDADTYTTRKGTGGIGAPGFTCALFISEGFIRPVRACLLHIARTVQRQKWFWRNKRLNELSESKRSYRIIRVFIWLSKNSFLFFSFWLAFYKKKLFQHRDF